MNSSGKRGIRFRAHPAAPIGSVGNNASRVGGVPLSSWILARQETPWRAALRFSANMRGSTLLDRGLSVRKDTYRAVIARSLKGPLEFSSYLRKTEPHTVERWSCDQEKAATYSLWEDAFV